jgi:hypothetical protein
MSKARSAIQKAYSSNRYRILDRDNNECFYCGSTENLQIDHIIPIKLGGTGLLINLVTACKACNFDKGTKLLSPTLIHLVLLRNCVQNMGLSDYTMLENIMINKTNAVNYKRKKRKHGLMGTKPVVAKVIRHKLISIEIENGFEIRPIEVIEYVTQ